MRWFVGLPLTLIGLTVIVVGVQLLLTLLEQRPAHIAELKNSIAQAQTVQAAITSSHINGTDGCSPFSDKYFCDWYIDFDYDFVIEGEEYSGEHHVHVGDGTGFSDAKKRAARANYPVGRAVAVNYTATNPKDNWIGGRSVSDNRWGWGAATIALGVVTALAGIGIFASHYNVSRLTQ